MIAILIISQIELAAYRLRKVRQRSSADSRLAGKR
jgi:hypothetical protein